MMPFVRERYPDNWEEISHRIRVDRAKGQCEFCGAENYKAHPETGSRVVLTVAHLDHDTTHNSDDNLRALCQRCHLRHDAKMHAKHAAEKRRQAHLDAGQMEMPLCQSTP